MSVNSYLSLASLRPAQEGTLVAIDGGHGLSLRLRRLGLRPGTQIRAVAMGRWGGPVLVEVDGCRVALGRGLARRILVQVNGDSSRSDAR